MPYLNPQNIPDHENEEILPYGIPDADPMVQHRGRHAHETASAAESRDQTARHEGADVGDLRRGAHRPGDVHGTLHRHSRGGSGDLPDLATDAAGARHGTREGPRYPGEDLLQERERLSRGIPQAQHGGAAGILQLQAGHQAPDHRDGCRTVGGVDRLCVETLRHRPSGLHGQGELRPEALPEADDEHLGRRMRGFALDAHRVGTRGPCAGSSLLGQPRTGHLGGR